ncbi:MAG TPA: hypothetical protein VMI55_03740 [Thermoplasmata archaeon]|nr:hypothetical protein [Thermoplasmata archaeon]
MEYVVVWASHPSWMTLQLPRDVAELIGYRPEAGVQRDSSRTISFLSRGPGVARVVATAPAREALAVETVRSRLLATARPGDRHVFAFPTALVGHLGLRVTQHGPRAGRGSDDGIVWFVPAPEYYEYRAVVDEGRPWTQPSSGPFAHVYLTRSLYPFPEAVAGLAELEAQIEEEWKPAVRLLQRVGRSRRAGA